MIVGWSVISIGCANCKQHIGYGGKAAAKAGIGQKRQRSSSRDENHGGVVSASGELGKGATFDVYIQAGIRTENTEP